MRIVIDGRMMGPRWTGIGLYTRQLIENLALIDHDNQYFVLLAKTDFLNWESPAPNVTKVIAPYQIYGLAEQLLLPLKLWRLKPDLVHFLHNVPILYRGRRVVMVHDTTMVDFDLAPNGVLKRLKYKVKRLAMLMAFRATASADMIITPSKATKDRLLALLKQRIQASRISVIYEATDQTKALERAIETTPPKLLYVGTLFPYKNVSVILNAMPVLLAKRPDIRLQIIGSTPRFNDSIRQQVEKLAIGRSVELSGFTSDEVRSQAYQQATLFIFPSLSEGFGLPPLEAIAQGLPVLAARASALPEILADGADYFDPHDPKDLAAKIMDLLDNPEVLINLQQRGRSRLKQFSWQQMAQETLELYKRIKPV